MRVGAGGALQGSRLWAHETDDCAQRLADKTARRVRVEALEERRVAGT